MRLIVLVLSLTSFCFATKVPDQCAAFLAFKASQKAWAENATVPFDEEGNLIPSEVPDTLYSWQDRAFLHRFLQYNETVPGLFCIPERDTFQQPKCFWRTPAGSFGYGANPFRAKLKMGLDVVAVPFFTEVGGRDCGHLRKTYDVDKTLFVSFVPDSGYSEYFLCSSEPLHSVSIFTPEHLQEIAEEAQWIQANAAEDYDLIVKDHFYRTMPFDLQRGFHFDGNHWSVERLRDQVAYLQKLPVGRERIFYGSGVIPSRADHFSSRHAPYWRQE